MEDKIVAWCIKCMKQYTEKQIEDVSCCPFCKCPAIPCSPDFDTTIKINWHELKIIICWAERWAQHLDKVGKDNTDNNVILESIAQRLERQHPDKSPLTMAGEIEDVKKEFGSDRVTTNISGTARQIAREYFGS